MKPHAFGLPLTISLESPKSKSRLSYAFLTNARIGSLGMAFAQVACTFTGANEDGGKRRRGQDGYGVNISGTRFGTKS